jgi:aminoglycoside phosphotransferase
MTTTPGWMKTPEEYESARRWSDCLARGLRELHEWIQDGCPPPSEPAGTKDSSSPC